MANGYATDRDIAYFQSTGDISRTNVKGQKDLDKELAKQAKHGFMNSLIGTLMQFVVPALIPGIGSMVGGGGKILDFLTKKPLGKMLASLGPKFLSETIGTSMYKPGDYKSDTVYGESMFDDITQTGKDYKTAGYQKAGLSFLRDAIISQIKNPLSSKGEKYGTFSEQVGIKPLEFGGYERPETADWLEKNPVLTGPPSGYTPPAGVDVSTLPKVTDPSTFTLDPSTVKPISSPYIPSTPLVQQFGGNPVMEMGAYGQQDSLNYLQKLLNLLPGFQKGRDLSNDPYLPYE